MYKTQTMSGHNNEANVTISVCTYYVIKNVQDIEIKIPKHLQLSTDNYCQTVK